MFVAVGAHLSKRVDIPARDAGPIVDALSFLRSVASGERPEIGRRVAVYGGGNTAMDAARVARRLGADEALIVYRRTREQMPAHEEEAEDAEREGVRINWLRTITAFDGPGAPGRGDGARRVRLTRSRPGEFETLAADTVILALGQDTDTAFLRAVPGVEFERDGTVVVSTSLQTGAPGVFAGGDMVPSERTVTVGVGHGKKAARHIDAWLREPRRPAARRSTTLARVRQAAPLVLRRHRAPPAARARAGGARRGLRRDRRRPLRRARRSTRRAAACRAGTASSATAASGACPEDAVIKLGDGAPLPVRLRPLHRLRRRASSSARCTRSRWSPESG